MSNDRERQEAPEALSPATEQKPEDSGQAGQSLRSDLEEMQVLHGPRPGDQYVRIVRPFAREFQRKAPGYLIATERALEDKDPIGRGAHLSGTFCLARAYPAS